MPDMQLGHRDQPQVATGTWRVVPARSHASFAARLAGRPVRGRLPLTGYALIAEPIEGSAVRLAARTGAVRTGSAVLDRLLAGPGFLDAGASPEVSFRSELLVRVPTGWRAVGRLQVKDCEHELACEFSVQTGDGPPDGVPRVAITSSWVIDSTWITHQRIPALGRRIAMSCAFLLEPGHVSDRTSRL